MRNKIESIEELENIYYGPDKNGKNVSPEKINKYEDWTRTKIISKIQEDEVKSLFDQLGPVKRIPKDQNKTYDFEIEGLALIEVTSINTKLMGGKQDAKGNISLNSLSDENKLIERINRCIKHGVEKGSREGYFKFLVIFYSADIYFIYKKLINRLFDSNFIRKTNFCASSLNAMIFLPLRVGGNMKLPEPMGYTKEKEVAKLLNKIKGFKIKELGCEGIRNEEK